MSVRTLHPLALALAALFPGVAALRAAETPDLFTGPPPQRAQAGDGGEKKRSPWAYAPHRDMEKQWPELLGRIAGLESMTGDTLRTELSAITEHLHEMTVILDTTPVPRSSMNVGPPLGNPGGNVGAFAGMRPDVIKDPDARIAYENAIAQNAENGRIQTWLIDLRSTRSHAWRRFDDKLGRMSARGVITHDEAAAAYTRANNEMQPWVAGDDLRRSALRARLMLRIFRLGRYTGEPLQKEVAYVAQRIADLATVLDTLPATDARSPEVRDWLPAAERTHADLLHDFRREVERFAARGQLPREAATAALARAARKAVEGK
jgi:hypothetical protein